MHPNKWSVTRRRDRRCRSLLGAEPAKMFPSPQFEFFLWDRISKHCWLLWVSQWMRKPVKGSNTNDITSRRSMIITRSHDSDPVFQNFLALHQNYLRPVFRTLSLVLHHLPLERECGHCFLPLPVFHLGTDQADDEDDARNCGPVECSSVWSKCHKSMSCSLSLYNWHLSYMHGRQWRNISRLMRPPPPSYFGRRRPFSDWDYIPTPFKLF